MGAISLTIRFYWFIEDNFWIYAPYRIKESGVK
jgi:hypothetical protein